MEAVVTSEEMRRCDRYAIEELKIPGVILMENAGRGVVEAMMKNFGSLNSRSVLVACGKGNNGGDGFVVARHLLNHGARVSVLLCGNPAELKGDAKINFESLSRISKSPLKDRVQLLQFRSKRTLNMLPRTDFIVDAIFGTGFTGAVRGDRKSTRLNSSHRL